MSVTIKPGLIYFVEQWLQPPKTLLWRGWRRVALGYFLNLGNVFMHTKSVLVDSVVLSTKFVFIIFYVCM